MKKFDKVKAAKAAKGVTLVIVYGGIIVGELVVCKKIRLSDLTVLQKALAGFGIGFGCALLWDAICMIPHAKLDDKVSRWIIKKEMEKALKKNEQMCKEHGMKAKVVDKGNAIEVEFEIIDE